MEANNIVPSNFTLGILVKLYGRRRQLDKAFEVVRELPRKHKFTVNAQVRTCLMCTCINNNSLERALAVFEELKSEQACDAKAYQSLINGCVRHGHLERAQILVEEACGLGREPSPLPPGQTLPSEAVEQLLRALASRGEMDRSRGQPAAREAAGREGAGGQEDLFGCPQHAQQSRRRLSRRRLQCRRPRWEALSARGAAPRRAPPRGARAAGMAWAQSSDPGGSGRY
ncbi:unnamed protein product [Prorocentrum cordatum]|uniref:Pentacotripeptide-repeat region of PRORP domain-containing protein n=1 Tax=Prorocentrum cordatum TaxID=2364126 RepID=A0ABN9TT62_9DINO|nr:unnamed protein product [Polarella glacialis]